MGFSILTTAGGYTGAFGGGIALHILLGLFTFTLTMGGFFNTSFSTYLIVSWGNGLTTGVETFIFTYSEGGAAG